MNRSYKKLFQGMTDAEILLCYMNGARCKIKHGRTQSVHYLKMLTKKARPIFLNQLQNERSLANV